MSDTGRLRESYDRIAGEYAEHLFAELAGKPLDRHLLNRFAEALRGRGPVCDLGCGPGQVARYLHEQGATAFGIDLSPEMIEQARARSPGLELRTGNLLALDAADGAWAGIASFYSIIHLEREQVLPAFIEMRRVLQPGGLLLLAFHVGDETLHRDELWGQPVDLDFRFYQPSKIVQWLEQAGFNVMERSEREPYADVEHPSRRCYILAGR